MDGQDRVFVAGHSGMVGSAVVRELEKNGFKNIITRDRVELDLIDQDAVHNFFTTEKIDYVILAAAKVGGVHANNVYPAEFIYANLMIETNVINGAYLAGVRRLLFLGSSCIYPKFAPQPMKEEHLLTGVLEPTNEPYAIAKIAGIKMCESYNRQYGTSYRSVMPTNLYGPGDNYHLENSHVIPAMIRKYHLAQLALKGDLETIVKDQKRYGTIPQDICNAIGYDSDSKELDAKKKPEVILWGTGKPRREFLHVDDMAKACLHVMDLEQDHFSGDNPSFVNVGTGEDITIYDTAQYIAEMTGFEGETIFNADQPDGTPRKLLDTSRITNFGWKPSYTFEEGLLDAYTQYKNELVQ